MGGQGLSIIYNMRGARPRLSSACGPFSSLIHTLRVAGLLLDLSPRVLGNFTLPFLVGAIPCLLVFWTPLLKTSKIRLAAAAPYRENAVKVTVPKDAKEGDPLGYVVGADSKMYRCVVPAGVKPGERFVTEMSD